ncbi:MAG: metal-dependent hydrolase [Acidobacteriota bacterium]
MENIAHSLFGAALYRGWFERYLPGTLPLWIIGANLPDLDVISTLWGKDAYLRHHRGITHALPGIILLALALGSLWWLWRQVRGQPLPWSRLCLAALVAVGTHPMLDFLNNYGIRPLLPFDDRWFYGDLVFIADPWIWLILGGALFLQTRRELGTMLGWGALWFLTSGVIVIAQQVPLTSKLIWLIILAMLLVLRTRYEEVKINASRIALALMLMYLGALYLSQQTALASADQYLRAQAGEPVRRFSVSPMAANPLRWEVFADSENFFYFGKVEVGTVTRSTTPLTALPVARHHKAVKRALDTPQGHTMVEFSRYLLADVEPLEEGARVILRDGRYARERRAGFSVIEVTVAPD